MTKYNQNFNILKHNDLNLLIQYPKYQRYIVCRIFR